jgi:hypothetical protein
MPELWTRTKDAAALAALALVAHVAFCPQPSEPDAPPSFKLTRETTASPPEEEPAAHPKPAAAD